MVRFHDNPEKYNSSRMLMQLDQEVYQLLIQSVAFLFHFVKHIRIFLNVIPGFHCDLLLLHANFYSL